MTVSEKRVGSRGYDQSLNLWEFDTPERLLEWGRRSVISPLSYLQRV